MSQSSELKAAVVVKKVKILKKNPVVQVILAPENSIWMNVRRMPKEKREPIVWEHIEDISDDENDTPQAAGKRLSTLKAVRDQMQRRYYENKLDEFQRAGLFLGWSKEKLLEPHPEQYTPFDYIVTAAYPY